MVHVELDHVPMLLLYLQQFKLPACKGLVDT